MPIARVAGSSNFASDASSQAAIAPALGNLLIVAGVAGVSGTAITISDSHSHTWTPVFDQVDMPSGASFRIWITYAATTSSITVTVSGGPAFTSVLIDEFSGTATDSPVDTFSTAFGTGAIALTGKTAGFDNELVYGFAGSNGTSGAGTGFTLASTDSNGEIAEYQILTGGKGSSVEATFTGSGDYVCGMVLVKPFITPPSADNPKVFSPAAILTRRRFSLGY